MAELKAARRNKLSKSTFGLPGERKYPMPDKSHARNALARASQQENAGNLSESSAAKVRAKAHGVLGHAHGGGISGGEMKHKHSKGTHGVGRLHAGVGLPPAIGEQAPPIGVGMPEPDGDEAMASPAMPPSMGAPGAMKKGGRTKKATGGTIQKNPVDKVGDPPEMLGNQFDPDSGRTPNAKKGGRMHKARGGTIKTGGAGGGDKVIRGPAHTGHTPMKKANGGTIKSGGAENPKNTRLSDPPEMKGGQFDPDSKERTPMEKKGGRIRKASGGVVAKEPSTEPHGKGEPDEKPLKLAKGGHVHMGNGGHDKGGHQHMGHGGHASAGHKFMAKMKSGGRC